MLTLITHTGTGGGQGYIVEYRGQAIEELSMEGRMTVCNMSIEWGAKAGLIAPDQTTFDYIEGRPEAPKGADWDAAVEHWKTLVTDDDAEFDKEIVLDASTMTPFVTWGTNPGQGVPLGGERARPRRTSRTPQRPDRRREGAGVHGARGRHPDARGQGRHRLRRLVHQRPDRGPARSRPRSSRAATVDKDTRLLVVPGSVRVRLQAEDEGLDVVFKEAGAEWRGAGCSMCLGMNPDQLTPGRAQRLDVQPQLRGPAGQGRSHPPGLGAGRRRDRRPRHAVLARRPRARRRA